MKKELLEAMEVVRQYDAGDGAVGSHEHERVSAAFRLLARYLGRGRIEPARLVMGDA